MTAVHVGGLGLIDDTRAVLIAALPAALAEVAGGVSDYALTAPADRNVLCAEPRLPGQGSLLVAFAVAFVASTDNLVAGVVLERWALRVRVLHHQQRTTTAPSTGTPEAATLEHESWRIAHGVTRACELALCRDTGLTSKAGIYSVRKVAQAPLPADPGNPAQYGIDLTLEVDLQAYDPLYLSPPT